MPASVILAAALASAAPSAEATPSPQRVLGLIRAQFRSHRPPPPYETYTLSRAQNMTNGYPDPLGTYTRHVWLRNADRAALTRFVYRDDARGELVFDRPAFNEDRDPGPPTADVFEPAPSRPHPISEPATPEPSATSLPVIGGVRTSIESDYRVDALETLGDEVHLRISPLRDPDRNRLREVYADKRTYELHKLIATDKLFTTSRARVLAVYPVTLTITMGVVQGFPVVTDIHAVVGGGYHDDGQISDVKFTDIRFPASLPDWYFDRRSYAQHVRDAPS